MIGADWDALSPRRRRALAGVAAGALTLALAGSLVAGASWQRSVDAAAHSVSSSAGQAPGMTVLTKPLSEKEVADVAAALATSRHDPWCGDIPHGGDDFNPSRHECIDIGYTALGAHTMQVYVLAAGAE